MARRVIVTGANGAGKSFVAVRLHEARPDIPLVSFDTLKLTCNWERRQQSEVDRKLASVIVKDAWILEGGPALLPHALPRAEVVVWLDPPELIRAWRLFTRPWRNFGKTRTELPENNVDWPLQQYVFAIRSLRKRTKFRTLISENLGELAGKCVWHCRSHAEIDSAVAYWCGRDFQ